MVRFGHLDQQGIVDCQVTTACGSMVSIGFTEGDSRWAG